MNRSRSITRRTAVSASAAAIGCTLLRPQLAWADEGATSLTSSDVLDFLYIDNAEQRAGETQSVVVALKGLPDIVAATLTVANAGAADTLSCAMSASAGCSALFSFVPEHEGTYEVTRLDLETAEGACSVDFTDCDASYRSFTATAAVSLLAGNADDGAPELRVYTDDGDGELTLSETIEEGAALAGVPVPVQDDADQDAYARSRSVELAAAGKTVVALDPGHVAVSSGAVGVNGTQEASCTWKIAQYCAAELAKYQNVSVVYTVKPGTSVTGNELEYRVKSAVSQGADLFVSLHLNSTVGGSNGQGHGAEIYVPYDAEYNNTTHEVGEALAQRIIEQLTSLGLYNRGVKIRVINNDPDYSYPNGDDGDYYGVIRYARNYNLPAIIVEHAFLDNVSDFNKYLSDDSKLQQLGVADAKGIVNYLETVEDPSASRDMHRLYNPNSGEHFYTSNAAERDSLKSVGWIYEGVGWVAPGRSDTPVYRLYNPNAGDHHDTTSVSEREMLVLAGWKYEGIGWYSDDNREIAVLRQYNPNAIAGSHNFTTDSAERDMLVKAGWRDEGIAWYSLNPVGVSGGEDDPYNGLTTRTPIMGASVVSASTMAAYYRGVGASYPSDVYAQYGAPTIDDFCRILCEEAAGEGVRAEVLFAQVCIETGNLRFGGRIKPEQCNFGGIGATDGGAQGADFSGNGTDSVRIGLRAQAQHLKAYASTDALNNPCVDPRFSLVSRGSAPLVENLGNGKWATDKSYASKLLRVMSSL